MRLSFTLAMVALTVAARGQASAQARPQASAQTPVAGPSVVVLDVAVDNSDALVALPIDSVSAVLATTTMRDTLARFPRIRLVDSAATAGAIGSRSARAAAGGDACNVVVPCALVVAKAVGARYVVIGKVSRLGILTWRYWGGLIDANTGFQVISTTAEQKGTPGPRVPGIVGAFAASINKQLNGGP